MTTTPLTPSALAEIRRRYGRAHPLAQTAITQFQVMQMAADIGALLAALDVKAMACPHNELVVDSMTSTHCAQCGEQNVVRTADPFKLIEKVTRPAAPDECDKLRAALTEIHGVTLGTGGPYTRIDMIRELAQPFLKQKAKGAHHG